MALNGSLDDYSPAGALRVLSSDGRTGAVRFTGAGGCTVYLFEGQLYFARADETDDAVASALVRPGRITADMWTRAVDDAGDAPKVGELLISNGSIESDMLASVVLSVIYDPLITLFREGDGQFEFEADTMHWIGPYRGFNVEAIVNEVRRRVRGVDEMSDLVPSVSSWVAPRRTLPDGAAQVTLLREDWELVTALAGPRTITEAATAMGRGQYSTAAVVHRLARAGLVEVVNEPFTRTAAPHEPSAAERMTTTAAPDPEPTATDEAAGTPEAGFAPASFDAPTLDPPAEDGAVIDDRSTPDPFFTLGGDRGPDGIDAPVAAPVADHDADDDAWEEWARTNPFDHTPATDDSPAEVSFGPVLGAPDRGPETAPDEDANLPRRAAVREADPSDRPEDQDEDMSGGLAGISGFQDPVAGLNGENTALAEAMDEEEPEGDPNAAWLENLYAQFIDEATDGPKIRKKEALDVAFQASEQGENDKVGTLRRLVDALRRV